MPSITQLRLMTPHWHCRFGWHSLVAAFGVPQEKLAFIPHGVVLPQSPKPSASRRHLLQSITLSAALQGASVGKEAAHGEHTAAYTLFKSPWDNLLLKMLAAHPPGGVLRLFRLALQALRKHRHHFLRAAM